MKRKIIYLLASCLIGIAMIAASMLAISCGQAEEEEEIAIPTEEVEEKEPAHEEIFSLGETVESDMLSVTVPRKIAVTVTELRLTDSYEYYASMDEVWRTVSAPAGSTFIIAHVKIKNISTTDTVKVGTQDMRGGCAAKVVPAGFYMATGLREELGVWLDILPGEVTEGPALFEVPKNSTDYYIKYRFSDKPEVWAKWLLE